MTNINVSVLNGRNGFVIQGATPDGRLGNAVSGAGDINNDGLDDLIQPRSGQIRYWLNYGNNGFSELYTVPAENDSTTVLPEFVAGSTSIQLLSLIHI